VLGTIADSVTLARELLEAVLRRYPAVKRREERTMKKARMDDDELAGSCAA
jgi:hypothetical protein